MRSSSIIDILVDSCHLPKSMLRDKGWKNQWKLALSLLKVVELNKEEESSFQTISRQGLIIDAKIVWDNFHLYPKLMERELMKAGVL